MLNLKFLYKLTRKKRRGVIRTIDFTVAFSLFIIIYVQFLLVLININFLVNSIEEEQNPAKEFADRILNKPGFNSDGSGSNWAFSPTIPVELGLLSSTSSSYQSLVDLNKLSRLNPDLSDFESNSNISYSRIFLDSRNDLGLDEIYDHIRISTSAFYNITVESTLVNDTLTSVTISATSINSNLPLTSLDVVFGVYELSNQVWVGNDSGSIGLSGEITFSTAITLSFPVTPYIIFAYAENAAITTPHMGSIPWGIGWSVYQNSGTVNLGQIASYVSENATHINHTVYRTGSNNLFSQTFYPQRDTLIPTYNLTLVSGNLTSGSDEASISTRFNSGSRPMFMLGFYSTNPNEFYYQLSSFPLLFHHKEDSSSGSYNVPSFNVIETSGFSQFETQELFTAHYIYEKIVISRRGPFIIKIEVASI